MSTAGLRFNDSARVTGTTHRQTVELPGGFEVNRTIALAGGLALTFLVVALAGGAGRETRGFEIRDIR